MVPTAHVADMLGISKIELNSITEFLKIKLFVDDVPAGARAYASYIMVDDFPAILKHRGWKTEDIQEAMQQFEDVKNRPSKVRGASKKKKNGGGGGGGDDDDDDDDDDGGNKEEQSVVFAVPRKRLTPDESSSSAVNDEGVSRQLKRMETMFEQSLSMMGAGGLGNYMKTTHWDQLKRKALQEAVAEEFPIIRESIKKELRAHWEPIIKEELRREKEEDDAEQEMVKNILARQSSPPE
jgi:hypothetical protein